MRELKGAIYVIISAVIFGCMPAAAKYIYAEGCNPVSLVVYRYSLSLPVLLGLALREQKANEVGGFFRAMHLSRLQKGQFVILSLGFSMTPVLLFTSYQYISSGSATAIHFSYPVFVILASIFIFKEKATRTKLLSIAFCAAGLLMFYEPAQKGGMAGILLALLSGITYTFYMMFFDRSTLKFIKPFKTNFYLSLVSAAMVFVFSLSTHTFVLLTSARSWGLAFLFSFMLTVVACVLFQLGIAMVGAQKTAILSTFEPITSVILGVVCYQEKVSVRTGAGVFFVLAAVLTVTLFEKKNAGLAEDQTA